MTSDKSKALQSMYNTLRNRSLSQHGLLARFYFTARDVRRSTAESHAPLSHGITETSSATGRRQDRSLFNGNYRTTVNVIRVTIPQRMRMQSSTCRVSLWFLLQDGAGKRDDCR
jgi:hypothetical protein